MPKRIQPIYILGVIPALFLAFFFFYPLANILRVSFTGEIGVQDGGIAEILQRPFFWRILWFTTWQAAASTLLTLAVGMPLAYVFAHFDFAGKTVLRALTTIPFVMPTVVVAVAFTSLLGRTGLLNQWLQALMRLDQPPLSLEQTIWIILLAHAFYNVSVIVRTVGGFWANLNPAITEAASVLGASGLRLFATVTLPLLMPSIAASSLLVFLFCFTSFGVVLILGGLRFATIEVEIYRQAVSLFNLRAAAFLSLVQMAITFTVMSVYTRLQARTSIPLDMRPRSVTARRPVTTIDRAVVLLSAGFMLFVLLAPLAALLWQSVTLGGQGITLDYYQELTINRRQSAFYVSPLTAVRNSLFFALVTVVLSLALGAISAYLLARPRSRLSAALDPIFLLPLGTSAVTLGYGYIISMGTLRTSIWLVPVAHTLIAMPFVVRTVLPALRGIDPRLRESAMVMGASPRRTWREVDVPILARTLAVGAAFAFTISLGEFGATLLVSRPDVPTMPVVIFRALGQPGLLNYGQALAMSAILMIVSALGLIAIERLRFEDIGEF